VSVGDAIAWSIETTQNTMRYDMLGVAITAQIVWWVVGPTIREALGWD
jgi:hypothetical protein